MRNSLTRALRASGIAAESFGSAEDYLRLGDPSEPSCLVLDVQLPGMSGFELQKELAARDTLHPPIIFISALDGITVSDCVGARVGGFLRKPFLMDELLELVRPHLSRSAGRENGSSVDAHGSGKGRGRQRLR